MMKVEAARLQQAVDGLEVRTVVGDSDVLEHADRGDLVESSVDQRIVAQLDGYLVIESEARDLFLRIGELLLRKRHADGVDAVMPGGVTDERPPAAADVEQAIARLQAQLAADHVELV